MGVGNTQREAGFAQDALITLSVEKKERRSLKNVNLNYQRGRYMTKNKTITFRLPKNWNELMVWLKQAEPLFKTGKYALAGVLAIMVIGMKDTIMAMEFDPSLTGLMVWVMMLWLIVATGFK